MEDGGVALIPRLFAEDDIRAGRLIVPLDASVESASKVGRSLRQA